MRSIKDIKAKLQTVGVLNSHGLKGVQQAYWPEVFQEGHPPGHGRTGAVAYLNEEQRAKHVVSFEDDALKVPPVRRFPLGITRSFKGEVIYVVDDRGKFYVGIKDIGKFHHSSFLSGNTCRGAGTMVISEDFKVDEINNKSGHYCPGVPQMFRVAIAVKLNGGNLDAIRFNVIGGPGQPATLFDGTGTAFLEAVRAGTVS